MTTYEIELSDTAETVLSERAAQQEITEQEYIESLLEQFARRNQNTNDQTVDEEVNQTLRDLGYL
jgi:hypothetical protein